MRKNYFFILITLAALGGFAFNKTSKNISLHQSDLAINPEDTIKKTTECIDTISFNAQIMPMIYQNCVSCHKDLSDFRAIASDAKHIIKALKGQGASPMPKDAPPLHDTLIQQFQCWLNQGKLNN